MHEHGVNKRAPDTYTGDYLRDRHSVPGRNGSRDLANPAGHPVPSLATSGIPAADPILHRWIRQYGDPTAPQSTGYEFKFYPDGTVDYREGTTKEVSSNIIIDTTYNFSEETGTWTSLGNMTYLVKVLPTGQSGAQIIREYTLVPAHQNTDFPGITVPLRSKLL